MKHVLRLLSVEKIWLVAATIPVVVYCVVLLTNMVNTPQMDDFYDILVTLLNVDKSTSIADKIAAAFWQYQQHMNVYDRLVYMVYALFSDKVDFRFFIVAGNIALIVYALLIGSRIDKNTPCVFLCVTALVFSLYHEEQSFWPMGSLQQFTIMAFAASAFILLDSREKQWPAAAFIVALAVFTQSNLVLVFPLGFLILSDKYLKSRNATHLNDWWKWVLASILIMTLFFLFTRVNLGPGIRADTVVLHGHDAAYAITINFFAMLASLPFTIKDPLIIPAIVGVFHFFLSLYFIIRGWRYDRVLVCLIVFCVLSLLAASIARTPYFGDTAFVSRYKIYCTSIICCEIILAMKIFGNRFFLAVLVVCISVFFNIQSYYKNASYVHFMREYRIKRIAEWFFSANIQDFAFASEILANAYDAGIYNPATDVGLKISSDVVEEFESCPYDSSLPVRQDVVVMSAANSVGMLFSIDVKSLSFVPDTVWLCGVRNYSVRVNNAGPDDFMKFKKQRGFLLLEKNRLAPGAYKVVVRINGGYFILDGSVDASRDKSIKSTFCTSEPGAVPIQRLTPGLYHQYCN